ncbi:unnamed protein product [Closterium sp. Yama58-4]|nr:unnamed protein product [Closterium sp. Yama58-4]
MWWGGTLPRPGVRVSANVDDFSNKVRGCDARLSLRPLIPPLASLLCVAPTSLTPIPRPSQVLAELQDRLPASPSEDAMAVIERELGRPLLRTSRSAAAQVAAGRVCGAAAALLCALLLHIRPHVGTGVESSLEQLLVTGVLHADPHPGNFLLTPHGQVAYLDFGLLCRMERRHQQAMLAAVAHLVSGEWSMLAADLAGSASRGGGAVCMADAAQHGVLTFPSPLSSPSVLSIALQEREKRTRKKAAAAGVPYVEGAAEAPAEGETPEDTTTGDDASAAEETSRRAVE